MLERAKGIKQEEKVQWSAYAQFCNDNVPVVQGIPGVNLQEVPPPVYTPRYKENGEMVDGTCLTCLKRRMQAEKEIQGIQAQILEAESKDERLSQEIEGHEADANTTMNSSSFAANESSAALEDYQARHKDYEESIYAL